MCFREAAKKKPLRPLHDEGASCLPKALSKKPPLSDRSGKASTKLKEKAPGEGPGALRDELTGGSGAVPASYPRGARDNLV